MFANQYHRPVVVGEDGSVTELTPVSFSDVGSSDYNEQWLQTLLYNHPSTLPTAEIDASFADLVPLCMEMDTPAGPVDAVYATPTGRLALLEVKLWRNPEARRKVIGQILDYATQVSEWNYSRLDAAVRQARRRRAPNEPFPGLGEWMTQQRTGLSEQHFVDAVSQSLSRGEFLLVIAGDGIREGAGAITQFLDRNRSLHFSFALIECAIYKTVHGMRFVQPRVQASTTIIKREFARLANDQLVEMETSSADGEDEASPELIETRKKYEAYWREFLDLVEVEDQQPLQRPATSTNQFFLMPQGSHGWVSAYLAQAKEQAGVYLTFERRPIGENLFSQLKNSKAEIDAALGIPVEWTIAPDGRERVVAKRSFSGTLVGDSRKESQNWLADVTQRFVSVFRPRIETLLKDER